MRGNLVAVGIIIGAIGGALWYVPLQPGTIGPSTAPSDTKYIVELSAPLDILGAPIPFSLGWNSSSNLTLSVYDCGGDSTCALAGSGTPLTRGSGAFGTVSWTGHRGQFFAIVPTMGSATLVITYKDPALGGLLGLSLFIFGALLFLLGIGLSRRPTAATLIPAHIKTTATTEQDGLMGDESSRRS